MDRKKIDYTNEQRKRVRELVLLAEEKGMVKPGFQAFQDFPDEVITQEEIKKNDL
ncbi:hypothetical protein KHQ81_15570 (plasmid) [Mycoplasmatota bacterium]|nr:hypothetical protein KHQ81_15570 [Mycoplasmatota bacterium]